MIKLVLASALVAVVAAQVSPLVLERTPAVSIPSPLASNTPLPPQVKTYTPQQGKGIATLRLENVAAPDGTHYKYSFETENGINAQVVGDQIPNVPDAPVAVVGSYQYISPEGVPVEISYTANENGYQPSGNVLPTPPPVPQVILRSIEYNAAHPQPEEPAASLLSGLGR